ncbi:MAG: UDP-N-acetylmuramoyl-L-alanine--D-glutamate ligase, partial [Eubacteriales bacterium]|nr:UDP-N-acetylmuramoyl-L-alanine--D-glutamate ligase [Eubacteriales bacterium]
MKTELDKLFDMLEGKTVTVIGMGVSNTPLIKMLADMGITVTARDKNENLGELESELESLGIKLYLGENYLEDIDEDVVFKTPGMRFDHPQLAKARERGAHITSEMELFYQLCPAKKFGITGSDGKTTTTTLIYEMLKKQGYVCHLGGNIGAPLLNRIGSIDADDMVITELSSFQLHTMTTSPEIAVITNLAPNHLDMHKSMDEYIEAKENIFKYQNENHILITNLDNDITRDISKKAPSSVIYFSRQTKPKKGVWLDGDMIMSNISGEDTQVLTIKDIRLPGIHNVENYMTAIAAVWEFVDIETINYIAKNFGG